MEGDNINFDSFTIGGISINLFSVSRSGDHMIVTTHTDLSGSLSNYTYNVVVKDVQ